MREDDSQINRTDAMVRLMDRLRRRRPLPPARLSSLTPLDLRTIGELGRLAPCTMGSLSSATGLLLSGQTRVVDRLVGQAIAVRKQAPNDRRCVLVSLTPAGVRLYHDLRRWRRTMAARMLCRLNLKEQTLLLRLFERMTVDEDTLKDATPPKRTRSR